jgi:protein phosphatase
VTKAVGATETIDLDVIEAPIESGDLYLLCSDGLHDMISDSRILEIVLPTDRNLQRTVGDLINAANDGGGKDNITALLMRCGSS